LINAIGDRQGALCSRYGSVTIRKVVKSMNTLNAAGGGHPDQAGYSSPGCTCPHCNAPATRVPRRLVDLLLSMFVTVSRYRCRSMDYGWEGNLRVKRHPLLMSGNE